jgi:hypothetical protein
MNDGTRFLEPPTDSLTAEQIAKIISRYLEEDKTMQRYELEVILDRGEIMLTDPYGALYKIEVIDCE